MAATSKKQLSNNNLIIVMVLITVLVVGVSALITKSLAADIALNTRVISAKSTADKQAKADVQAAPNLVNAYNNLGSATTLLSDALPTCVDFPALIVEMENIANSTGVTLKSVAPLQASAGGAPTSTVATNACAQASPSVTAPTPQTYSFTLSLDCTYTSLLAMLNDLEQSARPMRLAGLQITGSGSSMTANVNVTTYYQAPAALPFSTEPIK